jgi:hypothetical protein
MYAIFDHVDGALWWSTRHRHFMCLNAQALETPTAEPSGEEGERAE